MSRPTVLIVDDEEFVRLSLVDLLEAEGYRTVSAADSRAAIAVLEKEEVDAVVTDLRMPGGDGLSLLERVRKTLPGVPVVLLTGVGTITDAVAAMKGGAYDFVQKPVDPDQFVLLMRRALRHRELESEVTYLRDVVKDLRGPGELIGASKALEGLRALIAQVAPSDATVLITGESGTGKELIAGAIHCSSGRADRNLVRVNCGAISETLFESEFFGHRRGAFTSAVSDRRGRFAEAEGGTLVLDEIGTLKPELQAKLLRVLETGEYQVVGESRTRRADVRLIAATNDDLPTRVRAGTFRADLYYRLNVFPIHVPPLRDRKEDIPPLAEHFLSMLLPQHAAPDGERRLSPAAVEALLSHDWPGNVRELRNAVERALILAGGSVPDAALFGAVIGVRPGEDPAEGDLNIRRRMESLERRLIAEALEKSGGRKTRAAELLGIDPKNLAYYLRKHDLGEPS